jgi:dolichol-phosphate mannosyltransferase
MPEVVVFLPTYNERENIERTVRDVLEAAPNGEVYVVDDLSPDGTGEAVDRMAEGDPRITILHREGPRGRGYAAIEGLKRLLEREDFEYVIEMDADGSHDPRDIPAFLEACGDCDVVLGSRYVKGGGVKGWGLFRTLNSAVANRVARVMLGLPYRDATSGYRCFRREALAALPWDRMISNNPSIVEEMLAHLHHRGLRIREMPIQFTNRTEGASKFSIRLIGRWILNLWKVRSCLPKPGER